MSNSITLPDRAVVVPQNTLVAGHKSRAIRLCLRDDDAVEGIAGPPLLGSRADDPREGKTADLQTEFNFQPCQNFLGSRPRFADLEHVFEFQFDDRRDPKIAVGIDAPSGAYAQLRALPP